MLEGMLNPRNLIADTKHCAVYKNINTKRGRGLISITCWFWVASKQKANSFYNFQLV
jgi:hypothetical protein